MTFSRSLNKKKKKHEKKEKGGKKVPPPPKKKDNVILFVEAAEAVGLKGRCDTRDERDSRVAPCVSMRCRKNIKSI